MAKSLADVDEWQTKMQLKPLRLGRVELYTSSLSAEDRAVTGVALITNIDEAIAASMARCGDRAVAIIPEGPYVIPYHDVIPCYEAA